MTDDDLLSRPISNSTILHLICDFIINCCKKAPAVPGAAHIGSQNAGSRRGEIDTVARSTSRSMNSMQVARVSRRFDRSL